MNEIPRVRRLVLIFLSAMPVLAVIAVIDVLLLQRFLPSSYPQVNRRSAPAASMPRFRPGPTAPVPLSELKPSRPRPGGPVPPEPFAAGERANAIHRAAEAIRAQCRAAAGGDWDRWERQTLPYRSALKSKVDALKDFTNVQTVVPEWRYQVLEGIDGFPLFELGARGHLNYLYDTDTLKKFRRDRPVVAIDRWLRQRGIDLISVPVPKMTEVYIDHFLAECPPDGIITPQIRRTLLEMLDDGVEVVDGLPLFRHFRDIDSEYLYNAVDTHWAPRAMRIMARELADRIARYTFGAHARFAMPIMVATPGKFLIDDRLGGLRPPILWDTLTEDQRARATAAQSVEIPHIRMVDGTLPENDPESEVFLVGHSYTVGFREQLLKELNLLTRRAGSRTTEAFADFLRDPEMIAGCRVVIWISTEQHLTDFKDLPEPIARALESERPGK